MTATATTRYYSRDEVAGFESSETEGRYESWLSPYAIPSELTISLDGEGLRIDFRYPGEELGGESGPIDGATPPVVACLGRYTRKVVTVRVPLAATAQAALPLPADAVPLIQSVGERLVAAADRRPQQSERLSLRLTGKLVRDMASQLAAGSRSAPARNPNRGVG